jgi:sialate O-acetylesterase
VGRIGSVLILVFLVMLAASVCASAEVKPNSLFSDNAVLQRGMAVPVWGTAANGENVTVTFQNQHVSTTAKDGKWMVRLKPLEAGGPFTMTIEGSNKIELKNMLVGEVWACSGQSNMGWTLKDSAGGEQAMAASKDPMLRLLSDRPNPSDVPVEDVNSNWLEAGPESTSWFSGIGYFFGRDLRKALNVPVGLINASYGGTRIEAWMSARVLKPTPEMDAMLKQWPEWAQKPNYATVLYKGMIHPLLPYAIRGVIWYQGEGNAGEAYKYRTLFPDLIRNWREDWGQGDFPFLFVQLAPYTAVVAEPEESVWAELREAQLLTSIHCPNTAMAVITDYGDPVDIHPKQKEPVGARLALAARAIAYGEQIVYRGPLYRSVAFKGSRAVLEFDSVGGGLVAKDGDLKGFTIAGEDRKFRNAVATIVGHRVVVSSPDVPKPVAVRYAWASCPVVNLYNKEGLPASPFRTDDFPILTKPADAR